jgi:PKD repeat protein
MSKKTLRHILLHGRRSDTEPALIEIEPGTGTIFEGDPIDDTIFTNTRTCDGNAEWIVQETASGIDVRFVFYVFGKAKKVKAKGRWAGAAPTQLSVQAWNGVSWDEVTFMPVTETNFTYEANLGDQYTIDGEVRIRVYRATGASNRMHLDCLTTLAQAPAPTQIPVAEFSADILSGEFPLTVQFYDLSEYIPTSWEWDFGDESPVSNDQYPEHTYEEAGLFTVTLTATNEAGSDEETKVDYIEAITPPQAPAADFSADILSGFVPLTVQFTDLSDYIPTSWEWDFGDETALSSEQNPEHIYETPGTYTVTLTATNAVGSDIEEKVAYIDAQGIAVTGFMATNGFFDIPARITTYKLPFATQLAIGNDGKGHYNTATGEWTPPAGMVFIHATIGWSFTDQTAHWSRIYKNDVSIMDSRMCWNTNFTWDVPVQVMDIANGTDVYDIRIYTEGALPSRNVDIGRAHACGICIPTGSNPVIHHIVTRNSTNQLLTPQQTWVKITLDSEVIDTGNYFDVALSRFTPPANSWNLITFTPKWISNNQDGEWLRLRQNGSATIGVVNIEHRTNFKHGLTSSWAVRGNGTDYYEMQGQKWNSSSGTYIEAFYGRFTVITFLDP